MISISALRVDGQMNIAVETVKVEVWSFRSWD
jgi:hypothetical protein